MLKVRIIIFQFIVQIIPPCNFVFFVDKSFIRNVMPDYIILVHGEKNQMRKLKGGLEAEMKRGWSTTHKPSIATPENGVQVKLRFRKNIVADVLGSVADKISNSMSMKSDIDKQLPADTLLITEHFSSKVVAGNELSQLSSFRFCNIWQRQLVPIPRGFIFPTSAGLTAGEKDLQLLELAASYLEEIFDHVELVVVDDTDQLKGKRAKEEPRAGDDLVQSKSAGTTSENKKLVVEDVVSLYLGKGTAAVGYASNDGSANCSHVLVEWRASPLADTIADSAVGILLQLFSTTSQLRLHQLAASSSGRSKGHSSDTRRKRKPTRVVT